MEKDLYRLVKDIIKNDYGVILRDHTKNMRLTAVSMV